MKKWLPLIALGTAQFVMVLDQSVMNVSISQLVHDFDTTVTTIQAVITLYCLVMAMLMLTGGKIGDIIGRRRAFTVGLIIYACGSALTAVAPSVAVLALGWSILEGIGAALVLPALAALIAGNFEGSARKVAYAVIGGVAGAGIAIGPILGGWATTELSWRVVFVGEVVLVLFVLSMTHLIGDAKSGDAPPKLDVVGSVLVATGLGAIVLGTLQSSTWGWIRPKDSPVEVFGFSLTIFVISAGGMLLWAFVAWQHRRERRGDDPLVHMGLLRIVTLRSGLIGLFSQNLILMGVFFVIPLYLQLVIGLDALETGIKMLPVSITMFIASAVGSRLSGRFPVRGIVRAGLITTVGAIVALLATVQPDLGDAGFAVSMAVLGVGMGLIVSQLGNVVQSSVDASGRGEAGGLQYTGQQLGSSLRADRCHRAGRADRRVRQPGGIRPPDRRRGQRPGERRDPTRHRLCRLIPDRGGGRQGQHRRPHRRRHRGGLRTRPAPGAQGRVVAGSAAGALFAGVHRRAASRVAGARPRIG